MELIIGQTQRIVLAYASGRSYRFLKDSPCLRRLSAFRTAEFHNTAWFKNQASHENGTLNLSSVGFERKVEEGENDVAVVSAMKVFSGKPKTAKNGSIRAVAVKDDERKIDTAPFMARSSKPKTIKNSSIREVDDGAPFMARSSKPKTIKNISIREVDDGAPFVAKSSKPKTIKNSYKCEIDGAPFAAESFSELGLSPLLLERLEKEGLASPTDVQSAAIPTISQNHDVIIQSYTGSGKTLAYLLPILSEVGPLKRPIEGEQPDRKPSVDAVIVAPSRELGMQIVREVERLLGPDKKFVQQLVGGANRTRQEEALKKNKPAIVVGTPGRIAEISASGKLHTHACRFLVLDEVDQLLSFNYREDMHRIIEHVGRRAGAKPSGVLSPIAKRSDRQTILVSATVPFSVIRAAKSWGTDPLLVRSKSVVPLDSVSVPRSVPFVLNSDANSSSVTQGAIDSLPPALKHYYCIARAQHKVDTLRRCVYALEAKSVIAFMNNTRPLKDVVFKLKARGMEAAELHGDLGKLVRSTTMKKFKDGELRVLVTNELSARGLDVPECDLVVNLDLPTDSIHYAHRAGRTGRLGREGSVVTICEEPEVFVVKKLRRQLGVAIQPCEFTEGKITVSKEEEERKSEA